MRKIINIYPVIIKCIMYSLLFIFMISLIALVIYTKFELTKDNFYRIASLTTLFLGLPFLSSIQYIINIIDIESSKHNVNSYDDEYLKNKIAFLLHDINHTVHVRRFHSDNLNAFAISSIMGKKAIIAFSTALVSCANERQLLAIAAHEVAHIKNGDSKNKSYILIFGNLFRVYPYLISKFSKIYLKITVIIFAVLTILMLLLSKFLESSLEKFISILCTYICIGIGAILSIIGYAAIDYLMNYMFFKYSQEREFAADADGALMTSAEDMKEALELLGGTHTEAFSIFDTHPPLEERKRRLSCKTT